MFHSHGKKDKQSLEEAVGREGTGYVVRQTILGLVPLGAVSAPLLQKSS